MGLGISGIFSTLIIIIVGIMAVGLISIVVGKRETNATLSVSQAADPFVGEVHAALKEFYPNTPFEYDASDDTFSPITTETGDGEDLNMVSMFLGNLRAKTLEMGTVERRNHIRAFLNSGIAQDDITPEMVREKVVMRNRTPEEFALRRLLLSAQTEDDSNAMEPVIIAKGEMLFESVLNLDEVVQTLDSKMMRENGFAFNDLIQVARQNLLSYTPDNAADHWEKLEENIWISKLSDDFDSTRMFLFPEHIKLPFAQSPIVYAPSHTICLISSTDDDATLKRMIELGNESALNHRPLSRALWARKDDGWMRLNSEDRMGAIGRARLIETMMSYDDQKGVLDQLFEQAGKDIHVAKVSARVNENDPDAPKVETWSVFIGGGSYLPKTDVVMLAFQSEPDPESVHKLSWERFVEIIGEEHLKPHPDYIPVRYMFEDQLPDETLKALLDASTPVE